MLRCFIFAILVFLDVEQFLELDRSCSRQPKGNNKDRHFGQKHVVYECWDLSHTHWLHHQCPSLLFSLCSRADCYTARCYSCVLWTRQNFDTTCHLAELKTKLVLVEHPQCPLFGSLAHLHTATGCVSFVFISFVSATPTSNGNDEKSIRFMEILISWYAWRPTLVHFVAPSSHEQEPPGSPNLWFMRPPVLHQDHKLLVAGTAGIPALKHQAIFHPGIRMSWSFRLSPTKPWLV